MQDMVLCGGLGPGEEPGTWRPCKLEKDHDSPCVPVPDPAAEEMAKLRRDCTSLAESNERMSRTLDVLKDEMRRLTSVSYYEQQPGFATGVEWGIGELRAAMERCERRHR
jgi:hypothetical protein